MLLSGSTEVVNQNITKLPLLSGIFTIISAILVILAGVYTIYGALITYGGSGTAL